MFQSRFSVAGNVRVRRKSGRRRVFKMVLGGNMAVRKLNIATGRGSRRRIYIYTYPL